MGYWAFLPKPTRRRTLPSCFSFIRHVHGILISAMLPVFIAELFPADIRSLSFPGARGVAPVFFSRNNKKNQRGWKHLRCLGLGCDFCKVPCARSSGDLTQKSEMRLAWRRSSSLMHERESGTHWPLHDTSSKLLLESDIGLKSHRGWAPTNHPMQVLLQALRCSEDRRAATR